MNIIGLDTTKLRTSSEGAEFILGTLGRVNGSDKLYKYVKYNDGTADLVLAAGDFVTYLASNTDCTEVTADVSDGGVPAGVAMAAIAHGGYGWIQVSGLATCSTAFTGPPSAGNVLAPSATDRALKVGALVTDAQCAVCVHVANKIVMLHCPL